jgi:perosamine synthetase
LWSFGAIKTATALGGAIACFSDPALAQRVQTILDARPIRSRTWFLRRVHRFALLKLLSTRAAFTLLLAACRLLGRSHERLLRDAVRGFAASDLIQAIRGQPPAALLVLLARRLAQPIADRIERRRSAGEDLAARLDGRPRPGQAAPRHSHWVFPLFDPAPADTALRLASKGFDASPAASTLVRIAEPGSATSPAAQQPIDDWLYLPSPAGMRDHERMRLAAAGGHAGPRADLPRVHTA